ncbi:MAG: hypothetical protein IH621_05195 [Krumholzibacteria bacterium]|nr:hypothetical protein [Candidatus Krumholzibacteria bacterium]
MNTGPRTFRLLALTTILVLTGGCAQSTLVMVADEFAREDTDIRRKSGQRIDGYQLHGDDEVVFEGRARTVGQDSLVLLSGKSARRVFFAAAVEALDVVIADECATALLVLGVVVGLLGLLSAMAVSMGSAGSVYAASKLVPIQ